MAIRIWERTVVAAALAVAFALGASAATAQEIVGTPGSPGATTTIDGRHLPPPPPFRGQIDTNAVDSTAYWPALVAPPRVPRTSS
jgi:hypothetical protein